MKSMSLTRNPQTSASRNPANALSNTVARNRSVIASCTAHICSVVQTYGRCLPAADDVRREHGDLATLNPFSFVPYVRKHFDGLIQLAGGVATGEGIAAAELLGADMVCMGTRFIATRESGVADGHKEMLRAVGMDDVLYTDAVFGIPANFLRSSILDHGLDPDDLPKPERMRAQIPVALKPWSMIWSGGHSTGLIQDVPAVADLIDALEREYRGCASPKRPREES